MPIRPNSTIFGLARAGCAVHGRAVSASLRRLALLAFLSATTVLPVFASACSTAGLKQSSAGASSGDVPPGEGDPEDGGTGSDGSRLPPGEAGTIPVSSNVSIQVQPTDKGAALLSLVRNAKKSVHMTIYLLTDNAMLDALGDLKAAGKDVKVVLNQSFPPNGGDNTDAYDELTGRGVEVHWAPKAYQYTHAKSIIVDGEKVVIMTMNLTYTSPTTNREFIATDSDPADVADAEKYFAADFADQSVAVDTKLIVSPTTATPAEPRVRLKALIDSATKSLDVEVQSLSDDTLVDAIVAAHDAKVAVRVVIDGATLNSDGQLEAVAKLKQHGVPLKAVSSLDIHAKAIVADGLAFVGSQNFTPTALRNNREFGVVTDSATEVDKVRSAIAQDFAKGATP